MEPSLVDTHCHLELIEERDPGGASDAVAEAAAAGVNTLINIGLGFDNADVVARARLHPGVVASLGWHPHEKVPPTDQQLTEIGELAADARVVAVGEIGLDYHWRPGYHEVPAELQQEAFRRMLRLARELDLPVIVHDRDAHEDTLRLLLEVPGTRGTLHAFSGDSQFASAVIGAGMHISVAGPVTYPSAGSLREALAGVPVERLLVETDSPFLPPQPWRGKQCRPAMVVETTRRLAEVLGRTFEDTAAATTANARALFSLPVPIA